MPNDHASPKRQGAATLTVLPLVAALVIVLALTGMMVAMMAWWGGGDHMGMMRQGSAGADQTPVATDERQITVEMRDFEFFPAKLTVNAGTEVTWVNRDSAPHNSVADDGSFDTGNLDGGKSASALLDRPGTYPYVCTYHPGMEATVTVR